MYVLEQRAGRRERDRQEEGRKDLGGCEREREEKSRERESKEERENTERERERERERLRERERERERERGHTWDDAVIHHAPTHSLDLSILAYLVPQTAVGSERRAHLISIYSPLSLSRSKTNTYSLPFSLMCC